MHLRLLLLLAASSLLVACQDTGSGDPHADPADIGAAESGPDIVVSTNEPFWQVRIEAGSLVLKGVGAPERRFDAVRASMTAEGRRFDGSDSGGSIVVIVRRMDCEDDMSGARFPMTGLVTIDGRGPFHGCARPASMPRPRPPLEVPGVAADRRVPDRFLGRWNADAANCLDDRGDAGLVVLPEALRFPESIASVLSSEAFDGDALRVGLRFEGEGETWMDTRVLRLAPDGRLVVEDAQGSAVHRVRCDGQAPGEATQS